jgi:hypothetical protein
MVIMVVWLLLMEPLHVGLNQKKCWDLKQDFDGDFYGES